MTALQRLRGLDGEGRWEHPRGIVASASLIWRLVSSPCVARGGGGGELCHLQR